MTDFEKATMGFENIKNAMNSADGTLTQNAILGNIWNKIAFQKTIRTFNYGGLNAIKKYFDASQLVGGIDELMNIGMADRKDFAINDAWYKDRFFLETRAAWSKKIYEDVYMYSVSYVKMAQAFLNMSTYGSWLAEMQNSIAQQKNSVWYDRMLGHWQTSENYIEIAVKATKIEDLDAIELGKLITGIARKMTLPNTSYNKEGRKNATPFNEQNLVLDTDAATTIDWETARIFNQMGINGMGKLLTTDYVKFTDNRTIGILDTKDKFFIKEKYVLPGVQPIIANKMINNYLHEEYNFADLPWVDGVRFVLTKEAPTPPTQSQKAAPAQKAVAAVQKTFIAKTTPQSIAPKKR